MSMYVKKPIPICAFNPVLDAEVPDWWVDAIEAGKVKSWISARGKDQPAGLYVDTLQGWARVDVGDYVIRAVNGELYPCKPDVFAATYAPHNPAKLDFGGVIAGLKEGKRYAREGWNGKDMFIFLVPGSKFTVNREPLLSIMGEGATVDYHAHIDMKTAQGYVVPWQASQADMLANDWREVV